MSFIDRCIFTPTAGGLGDFVVSAAVQGYMTPAQASAVDGKTYGYAAQSSDLSQWEVGVATYTASTTTLARTTILFSSAGGAKVDFSAAPQVLLSALAEQLIPADISSPSDGQVLCFRGADSTWTNDARMIGKNAAGGSGNPGQDVTVRSGNGDGVGAGGQVSLISGDCFYSGYYGGKLLIKTGDGHNGAYAGRMYIQGGAPYGYVNIRSGDGSADYETAADLRIYSGNGYGAEGAGGYVVLAGGYGKGTSAGGTVRVKGGNGSYGLGSYTQMGPGFYKTGGSLTMRGGASGNPGSGGSFNLYGGNGAGGGYFAGGFVLKGGSGNNGAIGGDVYIRGGSASYANGGHSKLSTGPSAGSGQAGHLYLDVGSATGGSSPASIYINKDGNTSNIIVKNLPISSAGLPSNALWNNSGVINIT